MSISLSKLNAKQMEAFSCRMVKRYADEKLPPLHKMEVFLTEDCTLRCDYCFVNDKDRLKRMTWEVAKKTVDLLMERSRDNKELNITFFGGEPLLEFELMKQMAEYAQNCATELDKKITFSVTTNGTIMNEEIAMFGRKYDFNYMLSIDGHKETHDAHRVFAGGRKGSWDIVMGDNFNLLKSIQGWVGARVTVSPSTVTRLSSGVIMLFERGVNQFIIGPDLDVEWTPDEMKILAAEMHKVVDFYIEVKAKDLPIRIFEFEQTLEAYHRSRCDGWGCDAGRTRVAISTDGDIYPCSRFVKPLPGMEGYKLGTVAEGFTNIASRMMFVDCGEDKRPLCAACDFKNSCFGGCPATNAHMTGSIYSPTPLQCFFSKLNLELLTKIHSSAQSA